MAKICLLLPGHWSAVKGGAEYQAHLFAQYLTRDSDYEVTYLTGAADDNVCESYAIRTYERPRLFKSPRFGRWVEARSLFSALSRIDPDIVLALVASAHTGTATFFCRNYHRKKNIPMVWYLASDTDVAVQPNLGVRGPAKYIDKILFNYGRKLSDLIVAQTNKQAELMWNRFGRKCKAVVPNFHPVANETRSKSTEKISVSWIANFKKLKRPELFLDIAEHFLEDQRFQFYLIGQAEQSEWCDQVLSRAAKMQNVQYLGQLDIDQVNLHLANSQVLINTSEYEGLPNTFLQAWMRGVPTLTLNVDPDGVIEQMDLGLVNSDLSKLAAELRSYASSPEKLHRLGSNAIKFSEKTYSMSNASKLQSVLNMALNDHGAHGSG